jgi:hypothetical protein
LALRVKNWEKFQHYKSGRGAPPWIKLYRDLLNDKDWFSLDPHAAKFLISLWILCAETDGDIPDQETLSFRLRISVKDVKKYLSLCSHWVIDHASTLLANCHQDATPETETETETEYRDRKIHSRFDARLFLSGQQVEEKLIDDWTTLRRAKKLPITETAINGITREATKAGLSLADALTVCCERGWGGFKAEWLASDKGSKKDDVAWWGSEPLILAKGREVNLEPRPGESIHEFKGRVVDKLRSAA